MPNYELRRAMNAVGFFATVLIAIVILIAKIVNWVQTGDFTAAIPGLTLGSAVEILMFIANVCAYFIAAVSGFAYVRSRRNIGYTIVHILAIVVILFVVISNLF